VKGRKANVSLDSILDEELIRWGLRGADVKGKEKVTAMDLARLAGCVGPAVLRLEGITEPELVRFVNSKSEGNAGLAAWIVKYQDNIKDLRAILRHLSEEDEKATKARQPVKKPAELYGVVPKPTEYLNTQTVYYRSQKWWVGQTPMEAMDPKAKESAADRKLIDEKRAARVAELEGRGYPALMSVRAAEEGPSKEEVKKDESTRNSYFTQHKDVEAHVTEVMDAFMKEAKEKPKSAAAIKYAVGITRYGSEQALREAIREDFYRIIGGKGFNVARVPVEKIRQSWGIDEHGNIDPNKSIKEVQTAMRARLEQFLR